VGGEAVGFCKVETGLVDVNCGDSRRALRFGVSTDEHANRANTEYEDGLPWGEFCSSRGVQDNGEGFC